MSEANHSAKEVNATSKKDEDIIGSIMNMVTLEVETGNRFQVLSDEANFTMPDLTDDPIVDTMDPIAANRSSTKVSKPMFLL